MALIKCPECKEKISDAASTCPKCGRPLTADERQVLTKKKRSPLKIFLLVSVGLAVISAFAGKNDKEATNTDKSTIATAEQKDPCANIKTMNDWENKSSTLWKLSHPECNPTGKKAQQAKGKPAKVEERQKAFEKAIRAKVKRTQEFGNYELKFDELEDNKCAVTLIYPKGPMPHVGAELISKAAVLAIVEEFVRQGKNPAEDWTRISAWVQTRTQGVTGQELFNIYGIASYNWNNDQIEWSPQ